MCIVFSHRWFAEPGDPRGYAIVPAMFIEAVEQRVRLVRPRSFAGLMTLYASNHVLLRQLLGNLRSLPSRLVSTSPTDLSVHVILSERSRYTTTLHMTYWFERRGLVLNDPDLLLRIYHDARLAEAVSCSAQPQYAALKDLLLPGASGLTRRWSLNIFLNKWLGYCLDHRHRFA